MATKAQIQFPKATSEIALRSPLPAPQQPPAAQPRMPAGTRDFRAARQLAGEPSSLPTPQRPAGGQGQPGAAAAHEPVPKGDCGCHHDGDPVAVVDGSGRIIGVDTGHVFTHPSMGRMRVVATQGQAPAAAVSSARRARGVP